MVHYVGGDDDEDEWIPKSSERLRPPQLERKGRGTAAPKLSNQSCSSISGCDANNSRTSDSTEPRPIRRSRILSDDARLAMQLQEEEVKVARAKFSIPHKRARAPAQIFKAESISEASPSVAESAGLGKVSKAARLAGDCSSQEKLSVSSSSSSSKLKSLPNTLGPVIQKSPETPRKSSSKSGADRVQRSMTAVKSSKQNKFSAVGSHEDKNGTVSFFLVPEDPDDNTPAMKRRRLCLMEDEPVSNLIRIVVEEVLPRIPSSQIVLRTPSGMLVGHDHSLRYVRNFLWPRSRGDLTLSYSIKHDSLL